MTFPFSSKQAQTVMIMVHLEARLMQARRAPPRINVALIFGAMPLTRRDRVQNAGQDWSNGGQRRKTFAGYYGIVFCQRWRAAETALQEARFLAAGMSFRFGSVLRVHGHGQPGNVKLFTADRLPLRLALITEGRERESSLLSSGSRDLDMTTPEQAVHIRDLMRSAVDDVTVFSDLADFIQQAPKLHDAVVWPHWNGSRNRNRTGYAAAICEIHGLRYVGPDPYARLIANDKSLSKVFLRRAGLQSPASILVATAAQTDLIGALRVPVIVKPNMEGSSIGIDQGSVCTTLEEAKDLALRKLGDFPEGIIVEEFVSGPEVFISLAFDKDGSFRWGCSERLVEESDFLINHVYDYNLKFSGDRRVALRSIEFMTDELLSRIVQLTADLKTIDLIRLDGRLSDGKLSIIEITPDPLMTPYSEFLGTLALAGHEPALVIRDIVERVAARSGATFDL
jgi:D-alanine-D-alanine ligase